MRLFATRRARVTARIALYGGAILVGLPFAFSLVMTRTYRLSAPSSPPPGFEQAFVTSGGLRLRLWVADGDTRRPVALVVHGLGDSLESYLEHARFFQARGHPVALVDLRGHGGSEGSLTTLGGRESDDVRAAMAELRRRGHARSGFVLEGHSMGAVAVLLAAAGRDDVRAVIVEAPFDTYRDSVRRHAWLIYRLPGWAPVIPLAIRFAEWRAGFDADDVDAVAAAARLRAPLLAIVDGLDDRMPVPVVARVVAAHPGPKRLWVAERVPHVGAIFHPDYPRRLGAFLEESGV